MIEEHLERMLKMFGELPDPLHQPAKFQYLVMMYKIVLGREQKDGTSS